MRRKCAGNVKIHKLYVEWADGRHKAKKLGRPASEKQARRMALEMYREADGEKPSEIIGWDANGMAVFAYDFRSGEPVLW